jgi:hypothetical protein
MDDSTIPILPSIGNFVKVQYSILEKPHFFVPKSLKHWKNKAFGGGVVNGYTYTPRARAADAPFFALTPFR